MKVNALKVESPAVYRNQIRGALDPHWSGRLGGMTIQTQQHRRAEVYPNALWAVYQSGGLAWRTKRLVLFAFPFVIRRVPGACSRRKRMSIF